MFQFTNTQLLFTDIIQLIALLGIIGKLLIQIQIVQLSDAYQLKGCHGLVGELYVATLDLSPGTELFDAGLTHDSCYAGHQIGYVEQSYVPACDDVRWSYQPVTQELLEQVIFIATLYVL